MLAMLVIACEICISAVRPQMLKPPGVIVWELLPDSLVKVVSVV